MDEHADTAVACGTDRARKVVMFPDGAMQAAAADRAAAAQRPQLGPIVTAMHTRALHAAEAHADGAHARRHARRVLRADVAMAALLLAFVAAAALLSPGHDARTEACLQQLAASAIDYEDQAEACTRTAPR